MFDGEGSGSAIAGVVDRPRLYRVLDSPLVRICVLQGPSGCGKTTLVRSWALRPGQDPVTWVSLSGGITSRKVFWEHVASSATRLGDLSEEAAQAVRLQLSLATDPVRIASRVLADAGPVVIVFDAYEHLGSAMREIDEDLERLVNEVPELRIVVTSRAPTKLTQVAPDDGSVVRVITLAELALTPEEVGALVLAQTGIDDDHLASSITRATHGFPLTVRAVVLTLSQLGRIPSVDSPEWNDVVAARLESLLPDAEAVGFVTDTSVPPYLDRELAALLSETEGAAELLDVLERNGFGRWIPYAQGRQVFQYVETIRDTFLARARRDERRFRRACVATAVWLLENEEVVEQALQFAIDGEDYALADRVFVSLVIGNPDGYTTDRFLPTLLKVPEEVLEECPMLAFGLALALLSNPIMRSEGTRVAEIAVRSGARHSYVEPAIDAFSLAAMQAISRRLALRFRDSAEASHEVVESAAALPPELAAGYGEHLGTILRQLSYSLFQGGRIEEAMATIDRSVALCPTQTTRDYSMVYAAGFRAFAGDLRRARTYSAAVDMDAWPTEFRLSFMNGPGLIADGFYCLDALDFTGAVDVLRDASSYLATAEFWPFLTGISVSARHGLGQGLAEARRVMRELAETFPPPGVGDNIATERLCGSLALALIAGGDRRGAAELLESQPESSPHLASARIALLLAEGSDREALRRAEKLLELPGHTTRTRAETQTSGAVAALRRGDRDRGWAWLGDSALAWETYGPRAHVALLAPRDRRLLWEFASERELRNLVRFLDVPVSEARYGGTGSVELTKRERVVLAALAEHEGARGIAEALVVSPHTVKSQLRSIYRKLGVSSRQGALAVARESGLI